jgi:hypothetical protein
MEGIEMNLRAPWVLHLAALFWVCAPTLALACSPARHIDIFFDRNFATVPSEEVLRLANWMVGLRIRYPNHESIDLSGTTEPGEHMPSQLGLQRADNVARILSETLQFDAQKIHMPSKAYPIEPAPAYMKPEYLKRQPALDRVDGVGLDFLPACPHECPCQMGDSLYESLRGKKTVEIGP